jgi:uncharacterized membrane protein (UPF0136 family)
MADEEPLSAKLTAHAVATWVIFFALYLLFTGTSQPAELAVGGVSAGLVAAFKAALRARNERALPMTLSMLWPLLSALGASSSSIPSGSQAACSRRSVRPLSANFALSLW